MSGGGKPRLSLIVAMARNRVIGIDNQLPWHLPEDLRHFKALTMGHHIIMGRKTYDSIGRPLPGRTTVIITRDPDYRMDGCLIAHSLLEAVAMAADDDEAFFVGGSSLYTQALPLSGRLYITEIQADYAGDAHFPEFDPAQWRETARTRQTSTSGLAYDFVVYDRRAA
ncbi:MAG: dihydrofolate reductase [Gallionellaceae bacterium]|nr:dihydrofolate reductase [Gallionellaceae bacterium]